MKTLLLLILIALAAGSFTSGAAGASFAALPKVVFDFADDRGWGDLSGPGLLRLNSRDLDGLAREETDDGVGTCWNGDAEPTSNRKPDPEGAPMMPLLPDRGSATPAAKTVPVATTKPSAPEAMAVPTHFTYRVAIGHETGVTRRDPSDVLMVGDTFYLWYSKVTKGPGVTDYPSGYAAEVWYATSPDGLLWTERGKAVRKGGAGAWDERGVFTPNLLRFGGKYYLYYTGVAAGHNNSTPTHIGVAVAEAPTGPWRKFTGNPVLSPSADATRFDSMRVDDAALVVRDGEVWFYYKGRTKGKGPGETKLGVAFADSPMGPFLKHGEPLHAGHEVMVWPQGKGVASLATAAGPRMVYYAADGLHFETRNTVTNPPAAPGAWRSDDFENNAGGKGLTWGICHVKKGGDLHLLRFDCLPQGHSSFKP